MISFVAYLFTLYILPHQLFVLIVLIWLLRTYKSSKFRISYKHINTKQWINIGIISAILILSVLNSTTSAKVFSEIIPYNILNIVTIMMASIFTRKEAKILVYLVAIEAIFVIIEYFLGVQSLFFTVDNLKHANSELLYFHRPYGLGTNSTAIAIKILLAFIIWDYFKLKFKYSFLLFSLLATAAVMNFSRTLLIVLTLYLIIRLFTYSYKIIKSSSTGFISRQNLFISIFIFLCITLGSFFIINSSQEIHKQFSKGGKKTELSGRESIWPEFISFIKENPIRGNNSQKHTVIVKGREDKIYHAHNSFLQCLADHGMIIFVLYLFLIVVNINRSNYIYIGLLTLFSLTQYGYFWGISLTDIIFYVILFDKKATINNNVLDTNNLSTANT